MTNNQSWQCTKCKTIYSAIDLVFSQSCGSCAADDWIDRINNRPKPENCEHDFYPIEKGAHSCKKCDCLGVFSLSSGKIERLV